MQKVDTRAAVSRVPRTSKSPSSGGPELRDAAGRAMTALGARRAEAGRRAAQRRLASLLDLAPPDHELSVRDAASTATCTLARNAPDVRFAMIYVPSADGRRARLTGAAGDVPAGAPADVQLGASDSPWPLASLRGGACSWMPAAPAANGRRNRWRERGPDAGVFAFGEGAALPTAYLVVGVNAALPFDDDYRRYLELAASRVEAVLAKAQMLERPHEPTSDQRDEFLAMLAHELRNPLAPIRTATELLKYVEERPVTLARARAIIERQVNQLARLMDDLLDASRISRGKLELASEPVDVRTAAASAIESSGPAIADAGHGLTVVMPDQPLIVDGDAARLAQVLSNLLSNAAQFTNRGGHITLSAERNGPDVVVRVADDGIGIEADMLPRIFDLFTQVDSGAGKPRQGLGIGLTIARQLVELHGGTLLASSQGLGHGSEFTVALPALDEVPAERAPAAIGQAAAKRILVADDNTDAASAIAEVLRALGHDVRTADDGAAAVDAAEAFRPDLILLDIGMPRVDGVEACRRIRKLPWGRDVGIYAVTGWGQASDRRRTREAGFTAHLVKPVGIDAITKLIEQTAPSS